MQKSFSDLEYLAKMKLTRRDVFLAKIDSVTPWSPLHALIEPFYPKVEGAGRPPIGLARMLRMYVVQQCFGLSDEGIEDAFCDSQAIRGFIDIDLNREAAPDATTLLKLALSSLNVEDSDCVARSNRPCMPQAQKRVSVRRRCSNRNWRTYCH